MPIGRLPHPPTPGNMSLPEFGQVMQWGSGDDAARDRIGSITREELQRHGVTLGIAEAWVRFYENELKRRRRNPSVRGRLELMRAAARLLD